MNIITGTTQNVTAAFRHYFCMRMQFRSSVARGGMEVAKADKRYRDFCPTKH